MTPRTAKQIQRDQRLKRYAVEIPMLEARKVLAGQRDEGDAYIRRLERKIAHRKQRLAEGWPEAE